MQAQALRPYQLEQVANVQAALLCARSTLVEAATGTGKTTGFTEVIRLAVREGKRVLVMAHRRELVDQAAASATSVGLDVGIERGKRHAGPARVVCASIQTITRRLDLFGPLDFDLIVVDECHHAAAPGYMKVFAHFISARVLGVTATSDRADGAALGQVFDSVASRYGIAEAIAQGYLCPARALHVDVPELDLSGVRQKGISTKGSEKASPHAKRDVVDLHPGDLARAAIAPSAVEGIVGPLLELSGDRRTVVFAVTRAHARAIAASLCARRPGCARWVDGSMHPVDRKETLRAHAAGEYQYLVNVMVLTEGYDDPAIACVAMCRPTQSRALFTQACGRGLRLFEGKTECLILDFVGAGCQHTLVGPEDALAGALIEPPRTHGTPSSPPAGAAYEAPNNPRPVSFVAKALDLLRRAKDKVVAVASIDVGEAAKKAANKVANAFRKGE